VPDGSLTALSSRASETRPGDLAAAGSDRAVTVAQADGDLSAAFADHTDPVRDAYLWLTKLAFLALQPTDQVSGPEGVVVMPESWSADPAFLSTIAAGLVANPLVRPATVAQYFDDVRPAHMAIFQNLGPEGARIGELAERAKLTNQSVGYLVDYLEEHGYVERRPDPTNRRATLVCFTDRGWDEADACAKILGRLDEELTQRMGAERLEQLQALLAEATAALQASKLAIPAPRGRPQVPASGRMRSGSSARARGRTRGRKRKLTNGQVATLRRMYEARGEDGKRRHIVAEIAEALGVSRPTVYEYLRAGTAPRAADNQP